MVAVEAAGVEVLEVAGHVKAARAVHVAQADRAEQRRADVAPHAPEEQRVARPRLVADAAEHAAARAGVVVLPDLKAGAVLQAVGGHAVEAGVEAGVGAEPVVGHLVPAALRRQPVGAAREVVVEVTVVGDGGEEPVAAVQPHRDRARRRGSSRRLRVRDRRDTYRHTRRGNGGQQKLTHEILPKMPVAQHDIQT